MVVTIGLLLCHLVFDGAARSGLNKESTMHMPTQLRDAGIRVDIAPDPMPFWRANPVFTTVMSLGRPFVHVVTSAERPAADSFLWHEDVATCGSWHQLRPESRSILVRCPHDHRPRLPEDWHIDFVDVHPTEAWAGALRSALPDGLRRNRAPAAS
jgi:hypothetical protein